MNVEYEAVAIGAAAIAAVLIWNKIHIWKRIRALDIQLAKMQKEIDILQVQESRRLMMELRGTSRVESPKIDPDSSPVEAESDEVVRLMKARPATPAQ